MRYFILSLVIDFFKAPREAIDAAIDKAMEKNLMDTQTLNIATEAVRRFAETHPRPPHVSQAEAAIMLGISKGTLSKLVRVGTFKLNKIGKIPIQQIDESLATKL